MKPLILCYERCTTCKKALVWMAEKGYDYTLRPIKEENPSLDEITAWYRASGLPLKSFFNKSGTLYRDMNLKDKLPTMSESEQLALLSTDGMLVKRPLLITDKGVFPGFREDAWIALLG